MFLAGESHLQFRVEGHRGPKNFPNFRWNRNSLESSDQVCVTRLQDPREKEMKADQIARIDGVDHPPSHLMCSTAHILHRARGRPRKTNLSSSLD